MADAVDGGSPSLSSSSDGMSFLAQLEQTVSHVVAMHRSTTFARSFGAP